MGCGCEQRQAWLNERRPGLGDHVKETIDGMKNLLKPDATAIVWLLIGAFVAPFVITKLRGMK